MMKNLERKLDSVLSFMDISDSGGITGNMNVETRVPEYDSQDMDTTPSYATMASHCHMAISV